MTGAPPAEAFMAVNVGPYVEHELESHSHLAVTDFVLVAHGKALALEAGGPQTYDDPLYQSWYRSPAAHNVVTLPGEDMATDRRCAVDEFTMDGPVTVLRAHHHGYSRRVDRRILFVAGDPEYWLISDTVDGSGPATWSILGPTPWEQTAGGFAGDDLHVLPAHGDVTARREVHIGLLPGAEKAAHGPLHALRLDSPNGRFDVLLAASAAPPRLVECADGWQITTDSVTDVVQAGQWERRDLRGQVVAAAQWQEAPREQA
jgi:hypothetical protein